MTEIPQAATDAAAEALGKYKPKPSSPRPYLQEAARVMLTAAAPHIAAAERERVRQLAITKGAIFPAATDSSDLVKAVPFADLLDGGS